MKSHFQNNHLIENLNSIASDKMILRFIQDNVISDKELINLIDDFIASDKQDLQNPNRHCLHNTMFSMWLKILLFKYLYQMLKIEFLDLYPNSYWSDSVRRL